MMSGQRAEKPRIYLENTTTFVRVVPELAAEIGLNESMVLMQLDIWINASEHYHDGRWWTYQSLRDMREKAFPYWSLNTINRTLAALEEANLITSTDQYNQRKGDKTRWYSLNLAALENLASRVPAIAVARQKTGEQASASPAAQKDGLSVPKRNRVSQNGTGVFQNGTTLPEITPETKESSPNGDGAADAARPAEKHLSTAKNKPERIPAAKMNPMKDAIAAAFGWRWDGLTRSEIGQVQRAAKELCEAGVAPQEVRALHAWCKGQDWGAFGPMALAGNVNKWRASPGPLPADDLDAMMRHLVFVE